MVLLKRPFLIPSSLLRTAILEGDHPFHVERKRPPSHAPMPASGASLRRAAEDALSGSPEECRGSCSVPMGWRLIACRQLGWSDVPATEVDLEEVARGELAENADRKDFLPSEIDAIRRAVAPIEEAAAKERMTLGKVSLGSDAGKTTDKIGAFAGVSGRTVEKIAKVVEAAEREPEKFAPLVAEMDRTGKVNGAYRKLRRAEDEERVGRIVRIEGKFMSLVVDPPWDYEWLSLAGRATPGYKTMSQEELLALPVAGWAEDICHLSLAVHGPLLDGWHSSDRRLRRRGDEAGIPFRRGRRRRYSARPDTRNLAAPKLIAAALPKLEDVIMPEPSPTCRASSFDLAIRGGDGVTI